MNKRTKLPQTLQTVRKVARKYGLTVEETTGGKGSHRSYVLVNGDGETVGSFGLTDHPKEQSWTVLRGLENGLEPLFGPKWMEK
ncbi:hypothetical protein ACLFMI_07915 [Pseudonocardia nantongensis]|uniref:hypothetical protein n=1 Tax=Pseudonocardia nantongensis TaxID=1181885 RepID=UPI00397CF35F